MRLYSKIASKLAGGQSAPDIWRLSRSIKARVGSAANLADGIQSATSDFTEYLSCEALFVFFSVDTIWQSVSHSRDFEGSPRIVDAPANLTQQVKALESPAEIDLSGKPSDRDSASWRSELWPAGSGILFVCPVAGADLNTGAIIACYTEPGVPAQDRLVLESVAGFFSSAIELRTANQISAKIIQGTPARSLPFQMASDKATSVQEVLQAGADAAGKILQASRAIVYAGGGRLTGSAGMTAMAEYRASTELTSSLGEAFSLIACPELQGLLTGEIVVLNNLSEVHPILRAAAVRSGARSLVYAPVYYRGRTLGVLVLEQHDRKRTFTESELETLKGICFEIGAELQRAELYKEAQESSRRAALLGRITSAIHSSLDQDTVLLTIVTELGRSLSVCRSDLCLLPEPMPETVPVTHSYVAPCCTDLKVEQGEVKIAGNQYLSALLASKSPIAIDDVATDLMLGPYLDYLTGLNIRSILATAVWLGGKPIGFIFLSSAHSIHTWTKWEIELLTSVADQAALAIRQAEIYKEARESAAKAALLNHIVGSIRRSLDPGEILKVAVNEIGNALKASRVIFQRLDHDELINIAEYLETPGELLPTKRPNSTVFKYRIMIETGRTLVMNDSTAYSAAYSQDARTGVDSTIEAKSEIVSPIFVNDELWGVLAIYQTDKPRRWSASEIALVEAATTQMEVAISHSRLFEEAAGAARRQTLISRIINGINQSNQMDEILPLIARELANYLGCDSLAILSKSSEQDVWVTDWLYSQGELSRPATPYLKSGVEELFGEFETDGLICHNLEEDIRTAPLLRRGLNLRDVKALAAIPVKYQNRAKLGIVGVMRQARVWSDEEVAVLRAAADQVLIALERAELFEQVSRGKRKWESTFDALTDGLFIFNRDGILRRVNQAGAAFEGREVRDLIGRRCCSLLQSVELDGCQVSTVIETCRPLTFELTPRKLSQSLLVSIFPLLEDDGVLKWASGAVCVVRDLSQLRAIEAVAREQRNFLVKLIEHANDAIFALSPEGRFVWFNKQLTQLSGYSREEIFSSDFRRFLPDTDVKLAIERFAKVLAGEAQTFEMHGIKKAGETRLLLTTYTPIYDKERVTSVLCIARDITAERTASERAAQADKLRALGQLASGVAHNFNNILAAILGHAQLIKRDSTDERLKRRIEIIEKATLDGAQTVKRIQGFALQKDDAAFEQIDLNQLVQDSATLTRARWKDQAQASGLPYDVELALAPDLPAGMGSASELREVFVNIILNALDAMPQGGRLLISTEAKDAVVQVGFSDSGLGMSKPVKDRIFEPFFTTKGTSGMGLGLAVSYGIIEKHGGRIQVDSSPGLGSTFTITLPIARVNIENDSDSGLLEMEPADILVIDDDQPVREAIAEMLISAGHRAERASGGREGLRMLESRKFNIVFTDLSMPEMDGWAVADEVKRRWPEIKVVLATGYALPADILESRRDIINAVIFKPIRFDELNSTLNRVLS